MAVEIPYIMTGDCSSLVNAARASLDAVRDLHDADGSVRISAPGINALNSGLSKAIEAKSQLASGLEISTSAPGLAGVSRDISGVQNQVQALTKSIGSLGGSGFTLSGVAGAGEGLRNLTQGLQDAATQAERTGGMVESATSKAASNFKTMSEAARDSEAAVSSLGNTAEQTGRSVGNIARGSEDAGNAFKGITSGSTQAANSMGDAGRAAVEVGGNFADAQKAINAGSGAFSDAVSPTRDFHQALQDVNREMASGGSPVAKFTSGMRDASAAISAVPDSAGERILNQAKAMDEAATHTARATEALSGSGGFVDGVNDAADAVDDLSSRRAAAFKDLLDSGLNWSPPSSGGAELERYRGSRLTPTGAGATGRDYFGNRGFPYDATSEATPGTSFYSTAGGGTTTDPYSGEMVRHGGGDIVPRGGSELMPYTGSARDLWNVRTRPSPGGSGWGQRLKEGLGKLDSLNDGSIGGMIDTIGQVGGLGAGGAMLGGLGTAATAAVGLGSVYETMKQMPVAFSEAQMAVGRFTQSIYQTVAASELFGKGGEIQIKAADQLKKIGGTLGDIGDEVGNIGIDNMNTALSAANDLLGEITPALKQMEPAIAPAINGMASLGQAVIQGVSSPGAVQGIEALGKTLSDPSVQSGIAGLVSGAMTSGGVLGTVMAHVASTIGGSVSDSPAFQSGIDGAIAGLMMGPKTAKGMSAGIGGILMGMGAYDQSQGIDPTSGFLSGGIGAFGGYRALGKYGKTAGKVGGILGSIGGEAVDYGAQKLDASGSTMLGDALSTGFNVGAGVAMSGGGLWGVPAGLAAAGGQMLADAQREGDVPKGFTSTLMQGIGIPTKAAEAGEASLTPGGDSGLGPGIGSARLPVPKEDQDFFKGMPAGAAEDTRIDAQGTLIHGTRTDKGAITFDNSFQGGKQTSYSYNPKTGISTLGGQVPDDSGGFSSGQYVETGQGAIFGHGDGGTTSYQPPAAQPGEPPAAPPPTLSSGSLVSPSDFVKSGGPKPPSAPRIPPSDGGGSGDRPPSAKPSSTRGGRDTLSQIGELARNAGFTGQGVADISAIAMAESGGNPNAENYNKNKTTDYGLTQINSVHGYSPSDSLDPQKNLEEAYKVSGGGKDFTPWTTYKTGAYEKFMPAAQAATGEIPSHGFGQGASPISPSKWQELNAPPGGAAAPPGGGGGGGDAGDQHTVSGRGALTPAATADVPFPGGGGQTSGGDAMKYPPDVPRSIFNEEPPEIVTQEYDPNIAYYGPVTGPHPTHSFVTNYNPQTEVSDPTKGPVHAVHPELELSKPDPHVTEDLALQDWSDTQLGMHGPGLGKGEHGRGTPAEGPPPQQQAQMQAQTAAINQQSNALSNLASKSHEATQAQTVLGTAIGNVTADAGKGQTAQQGLASAQNANTTASQANANASQANANAVDGLTGSVGAAASGVPAQMSSALSGMAPQGLTDALGMGGPLGVGGLSGLSGIASAVGLGPGTAAAVASAAAPGIASGIGAATGAGISAAAPATNAAATDVGSGVGASLGAGASSAASTGNAAAGGASAGDAGASGTGSGPGADSSSPSRKSYKVGLWIGEGLVVGMKESEPSVAKAGASVGRAGVDATSEAVNQAAGGAVTAMTDSAAQAVYNTELAGGFGAGLIAASNGVTPIAQDYGLLIGYSWAENVVTGAQNVFQSSQFQALTVPKFSSALAQSSLGALGLLPPAGSGAQYYTTTSGSAGMVAMPPITVTNTVMLDGQVIDAKVNTQINTAMNDLANSIPNQRG